MGDGRGRKSRYVPANVGNGVMVVSAELAEFILARVAEVEQMARDAGGDTWVNPRITGLNSCIVEGGDITIHHDGGQTAEQASHIAYWDPARVLAKCKADRMAVLALMLVSRQLLSADVKVIVQETLAALAWEHRDHSDYRPEWTPEVS
jgi:hypothetical protein